MNRKAQKSLEHLSKISHDAIMCGKGPLADYSCKQVFKILNWTNLVFDELRNEVDNYIIDWKTIYNYMLQLEPEYCISIALGDYVYNQYRKQVPAFDGSY